MNAFAAVPAGLLHPAVEQVEYIQRAQYAVYVEPETVAEYVSRRCPECQQVPGVPDGKHVFAEMDLPVEFESTQAVIVGCEGYQVIDPNLLGIEAPSWEDWTK